MPKVVHVGRFPSFVCHLDEETLACFGFIEKQLSERHLLHPSKHPLDRNARGGWGGGGRSFVTSLYIFHLIYS